MLQSYRRNGVPEFIARFLGSLTSKFISARPVLKQTKGCSGGQRIGRMTNKNSVVHSAHVVLRTSQIVTPVDDDVRCPISYFSLAVGQCDVIFAT